MGKPKRSGSGFSAPKPATYKQQAVTTSADHAAKEQQAVALINQGNLQEAEAIYRDLIAAGTRNHIVYGNLAAICGMQGRFDELMELLKKALQLKPNYPEAHWNSSMTMLLGGDYKNGWEKYEWRTKKEKSTSKPHALPKCDQWGDELRLKTTSQLLLRWSGFSGQVPSLTLRRGTAPEKGVPTHEQTPHPQP